MGDIHAKICDDEFSLFTTKFQLRPESNRIEICEKPVKSGSPGLEPSAGKICVGRPDGSGACVGLVSAAEDAATVNVVVGSSGSVSVDVGVSVVDGCEATARGSGRKRESGQAGPWSGRGEQDGTGGGRGGYLL